MKLKSVMALLFLLSTLISSDAGAQEWPQFRGPDGNGVLPQLEHPVEWGSDRNIAWSIDLPGGGLSSPIVHGERIFLTTAIGAAPPVSYSEGVRDMSPQKPETALKFHVICFQVNDGSKLWEKTIVEKQPEYPIHGSNSFATESPATDGKHLFVYFAAVGTVAALDFDGNEIWRQELGAYPTGNNFGSGSSLTTGEGKVFIQCDNDESSFVLALNAATGEEVWRRERQSRTSWATPVFWENDRRAELITCGSGFVTSYDPASGEELWTITNIGGSFSASPASDKQFIYLGNSGPRSSGPLLAIDSEMEGDRKFDPDEPLEHLAWSKMQAGPGMASPVSVGGYLYIPGRGILTCYSSKDGTVAFKQRLELSSMAASLWAAGDRVFLMDEDGKTLVLEVGPEFNIIATNQISDDLFWSTPAVIGNSLLIRGVKKLYCIRGQD